MGCLWWTPNSYTRETLSANILWWNPVAIEPTPESKQERKRQENYQGGPSCYSADTLDID